MIGYKKLIDTIRRKIIDFRCHVSEKEIDTYIYNGGGKKFLTKFRDVDGISIESKPNRLAIRQFLSSRKRRILYNEAVDKATKDEKFDVLFDSKNYGVDPGWYDKKQPVKSKYANFKEAYWSEQSPLSVAQRIIISGKSLLLKTKPVNKVSKQDVIKKDYESFGKAYKDINKETDFYAIGTYPSAKPLEQMNKALQADKNAPKKIKQGAKQVISAIEDLNKPVQQKPKRSKTIRKRKTK